MRSVVAPALLLALSLALGCPGTTSPPPANTAPAPAPTATAKAPEQGPAVVRISVPGMT